MSQLDRWAAEAWSHHQAGRVDQAQQLYRAILERDPSNARVWHYAGVAAQQAGNLSEAVAALERAVALDPQNAEALNHLGVAYASSKRSADAHRSFRQAIALNAQDAQTRFNFATLLAREGDGQAAIAEYRAAIVINPQFAEAWFNLGNSLKADGQLESAIHAFRQARAARPGYRKATLNLAHALRDNKQLDEAAAAFGEVLAQEPANATALHGLATVRHAERRLDEAVSHFEAALAIRPDYAEAHNNLGCVLQDQELLDRAEDCFRRALAVQHDFAQAHNNLGSVLQMQNRLDEARAAVDHALELDPDFAEAHYNRSLILLGEGNFSEGWREYEYRRQCRHTVVQRIDKPLWDGSPLAGSTILLHAEQGLGDILQFVRYAPLVEQRGGRVYLGVPDSLFPLLEASGYAHLIVSRVALHDFDLQAPLLSLPRIFETTLETIPANVPYLQAAPQLVEQWRRALDDVKGFRIGINWQGNPSFALDRFRSIALKQFAPLAEIDTVRLISLQKKHGLEQLADDLGFDVLNLADRLDESTGAFMDTAAVMRNVDLVVTSDTAVAHLAGGLGVPVWLALANPAEWRWLRDRTDSPWYPTMTLFRQQQPGDWSSVFAHMAARVRELVSAGTKPGAGAESR